MKEILIQMEEKLYAIDSSCVLEIVPLVQFEPVEDQNGPICGEMVYHGLRLPVIDLSMLLRGRPYPKKFSTRILIVEQEEKQIAVIAEGLTGLDFGDTSGAEKLDLKAIVAS